MKIIKKFDQFSQNPSELRELDTWFSKWISQSYPSSMYRKKILASLWMIVIQLRSEMSPDVLQVLLKHIALKLECHSLYDLTQSTMWNSKFYYKDILTYQIEKNDQNFKLENIYSIRNMWILGAEMKSGRAVLIRTRRRSSITWSSICFYCISWTVYSWWSWCNWTDSTPSSWACHWWSTSTL